jgi:hypothetical protein
LQQQGNAGIHFTAQGSGAGKYHIYAIAAAKGFGLLITYQANDGKVIFFPAGFLQAYSRHAEQLRDSGSLMHLGKEKDTGLHEWDLWGISDLIFF